MLPAVTTTATRAWSQTIPLKIDVHPMLLLIPEISQATFLLRWLLLNPGQCLQRGRNMLSEKLFQAGIIDKGGNFHSQLPMLLKSIENRDVVNCLPPESKERRLSEWIASLSLEEYEDFIAVLREAANTMSETPPKKSQTPTIATTTDAGSGRGHALLTIFRERPLDPEWLGNCNFQEGPTKRIVWPLPRTDLLSESMVDELQPGDEDLTKWRIYRAVAGSPSPETLRAEADRWGGKQSSIPAIKAWVKRHKGEPPPVLPAQLILHLGSSTIRVALFSAQYNARNKDGQSGKRGRGLEVFNARATPVLREKGFTVSGPPEAKTFNAAVGLKDLSNHSNDEIYEFTRGAWEKLNDAITEIHGR